MNLSDLNNVRKLRVLKELLILEKYDEINDKYLMYKDPKSYSSSGKNVVYNIEELNKVLDKRNYGYGIEIIDKITNALNSRMFQVKCEKLWENLVHTEEPGVKFCKECSRHVFEVKDEIEFNKRKHLHQCVFYNPEITTETADGICVVEAEHEQLLGFPIFDSEENESDKLLPFQNNDSEL